MRNKDNFVSRNRDAINAIGHTLNALQNAKIRENQESIVRLAAVNAKLRQKNVRVNEEILETQKRHLEDKEREEKQNVLIKKLMLKIGPELEDLTNELTEKGINDDTYQEYLDAKIMIGFISNYRELIEDINYQRLIREQEKKINSFSDQLDTNSNSFKEIVFQILQENVEVLHSLNTLYEINQNNPDIETENLEEATRILSNLYGDPIKTTIISESLKQIEKTNLKLENLAFEENFLTFSLSITHRINDYQFFQREIFKKIESFSDKISQNARLELLSYLKKYMGVPVANTSMRYRNDHFKGMNFDRILSLFAKVEQFSDDVEDMDIIFYLNDYIYFIRKSIDSIEKMNNGNQLSILAEQIEILEGKTNLGIDQNNILEKLQYLKEKIALLEKVGKYPPHLWRIKQTQANNRSNKNCFVVTATTGSSDNAIVNDFRNFRDKKLMNHFFGRVFISIYYKIGPHLAKLIRKNESLRNLILEYFINPIHKLIE